MKPDSILQNDVRQREALTIEAVDPRKTAGGHVGFPETDARYSGSGSRTSSLSSPPIPSTARGEPKDRREVYWEFER
jgi:hypothetical protein